MWTVVSVSQRYQNQSKCDCLSQRGQTRRRHRHHLVEMEHVVAMK